MKLFSSGASNAPKKLPFTQGSMSLGGHRSLTVLIVALVLFISICVYFVNVVVLSTGTDDAYRAQAEAKAQLINFNTSLLKQAQSFTANSNNTDLPAGRIDPFTTQ